MQQSNERGKMKEIVGVKKEEEKKGGSQELRGGNSEAATGPIGAANDLGPFPTIQEAMGKPTVGEQGHLQGGGFIGGNSGAKSPSYAAIVTGQLPMSEKAANQQIGGSLGQSQRAEPFVGETSGVAAVSSNADKDLGKFAMIGGAAGQITGGRLDEFIGGQQPMSANAAGKMAVPGITNEKGGEGKRSKKAELDFNTKENVAKPQNVVDENAIEVAAVSSNADKDLGEFAMIGGAAGQITGGRLDEFIGGQQPMSANVAGNITIPRKTNEKGGEGKRSKKAELEVNTQENVAKLQDVVDENAIGAGSPSIAGAAVLATPSPKKTTKRKASGSRISEKKPRACAAEEHNDDGASTQGLHFDPTRPSTSSAGCSSSATEVAPPRTAPHGRKAQQEKKKAGKEINIVESEVKKFLKMAKKYEGNGYPKRIFSHAKRQDLVLGEAWRSGSEIEGEFVVKGRKKCMICRREKMRGGKKEEVIFCHGHLNGELDEKEEAVKEARRTSIPCGSCFHLSCLEVFNAGDLDAPYQAAPHNQAAILCNLSMCEHCNHVYHKQSAYVGPVVECLKCVRAHHIRCLPIGAKNVTLITKSNKFKMMICPAHSEEAVSKIQMDVRRCHKEDCEVSTGELLNCITCNRSFHRVCQEVETVDGEELSGAQLQQCQMCLTQTNIPIDTPVAAHDGKSFYPATTCHWESAGLPDEIKESPNFNRLGFTVIKSRVDGTFSILSVDQILEPTSVLPTTNDEREKEMWAGLEKEYRDQKSSRCPQVYKKVRHETENFMIFQGDGYVPQEIMTSQHRNIQKIQKIVRKRGESKEDYEERKIDELDDGNCKCLEDAEGNRCTSYCSNILDSRECPPECDAKPGVCRNRTVSNRQFKGALVLRKTKGKGLGVYTTESCNIGDVACIYTGEIINQDERDWRDEVVVDCRDKQAAHYVTNIAKDRHVDSVTYGNIARYINHSCDPNAIMAKRRVLVMNMKTHIATYEEVIVIEYIKPLGPSEEVTIAYGFDYARITILPGCICRSFNCDGKMTWKTKNSKKTARSTPSIPYSSASPVLPPSSSNSSSNLDDFDPEMPSTSKRTRTTAPEEIETISSSVQDLDAHLSPVPAPSDDDVENQAPEMVKRRGGNRLTADNTDRLRTRIEEELRVATRPFKLGDWRGALAREFGNDARRGYEQLINRIVDTIIVDKERPAKERITVSFLTKRPVGDELKREFEREGGDLELCPRGFINSATVNGIPIISGGGLMGAAVEEEGVLENEGGNEETPAEVEEEREANRGKEKEAETGPESRAQEKEAAPGEPAPSEGASINIREQVYDDFEAEEIVGNDIREEEPEEQVTDSAKAPIPAMEGDVEEEGVNDVVVEEVGEEAPVEVEEEREANRGKEKEAETGPESRAQEKEAAPGEPAPSEGASINIREQVYDDFEAEEIVGYDIREEEPEEQVTDSAKAPIPTLEGDVEGEEGNDVVVEEVGEEAPAEVEEEREANRGKEKEAETGPESRAQEKEAAPGEPAPSEGASINIREQVYDDFEAEEIVGNDIREEEPEEQVTDYAEAPIPALDVAPGFSVIENPASDEVAIMQQAPLKETGAEAGPSMLLIQVKREIKDEPSDEQEDQYSHEPPCKRVRTDQLLPVVPSPVVPPPVIPLPVAQSPIVPLQIAQPPVAQPSVVPPTVARPPIVPSPIALFPIAPPPVAQSPIVPPQIAQPPVAQNSVAQPQVAPRQVAPPPSCKLRFLIYTVKNFLCAFHNEELTAHATKMNSIAESKEDKNVGATTAKMYLQQLMVHSVNHAKESDFDVYCDHDFVPLEDFLKRLKSVAKHTFDWASTEVLVGEIKEEIQKARGKKLVVVLQKLIDGIALFRDYGFTNDARD